MYRDAYGKELSKGDKVAIYKKRGKQHINIKNFIATKVIASFDELHGIPIAYFHDKKSYTCDSLKRINK